MMYKTKTDKIYQSAANIFPFLSILLFAGIVTAGQNVFLGQGNITPSPLVTDVVIPPLPNQGENFLRDSLNIIPNDLDEFKVGGGSVIFPPAGGYKFDFKSSPGFKVAPVLSCGGLNMAASLKSSVNNVKEGIMGAYFGIQNVLTSAITNAPMLLLASISPTLYEVFTKGIDASLDEFLGVEIPSCQDIKAFADEVAEEGKTNETGLIRNVADGVKTGHTKVKRAVSKAFADAQAGIDKVDAKALRRTVEQKAKENAQKGEKVSGTNTTLGGVNEPPMTTEAVVTPQAEKYATAMGPGSLLAAYVGRGTTETVSPTEAKEALVKPLIKTVGVTTVQQEETSGNPTTNAQTTPGVGGGSIYTDIQSNLSRVIATIISSINQSSPIREVTAEDVITIRRAAAGVSLPKEIIRLMAEGVRDQDGAMLRSQAWLISALAYRKMVVWLMLEKQLITVMATDQTIIGEPMQQSIFQRIASGFSSIWSRDEMSLIKEMMEADRNIAEAIQSILALRDKRDKSFKGKPGG